MSVSQPATQSIESLEPRVLYTVGSSYIAPATPRTTLNENSAWSVNGGATIDLPYVRDATNGATGTDTFTKTIAATAAMAGKRIYLHFEGAYLTTSLAIDGTAIDFNPVTPGVDSHNGGFAAFDFDVTNAMQTVGNHTFKITVASNNNNNVAPASGGDYYRQGGIYRDLSLTVLNPVQVAVNENIGHLGLSNQAADTTSQISSPGVRFWNDDVVSGIAATTGHVSTTLSNLQSADTSVNVTTYLVDAAGVTRAQVSSAATLTAGQTGSAINQDLSVSAPHLWDGRADPYLYTLYTEVRDGATNKLLDLQQQNVGLRTIKINHPANAADALTNPPFMLNGHAYRLVGVDMHQDTGLLDSRGNPAGWERSDAQTRADINIALDLGVTGIRTSHYQDSQAFYDYCDKVGILVYTEHSINGSVTAGDAFTANAEDQYQELIRQNYNHPSVFAWGFGNETSDSPALLNLVKQLQKIAKGTTVTNSTTGEKTVVLSANDPSPLDQKRFTAWAMYGGTTPSFTSNGDGTSSPSNSYAVADIMGTHIYTYWYGGQVPPGQSPLQPQGVTEYGGGGAAYQYQDVYTLPKNTDANNVTSVYHPQNQQVGLSERAYTDLTNLGFLWGQFTWQMFDHPDGKTEGDITHTNDKGLVTRDRVKKDSFYFYQAVLNNPAQRYANQRVLKLSDSNWTVRNSATPTITVFSNIGVPTVTVSGVAVPMIQLVINNVPISSTYVNSSTVTLQPGPNTVNVAKTYTDGQEYSDSAVWTYRNAITGTSIARIDFGPSSVTPASGYVLDSGATYGTSGRNYGWLAAGGNVLALQSTKVGSGTASTSFLVGSTSLTKDGLNLSYDLLTRKSSVWEYALPNGIYDVRIGAGRSGATDGVNNFTLETKTAAIDSNGAQGASSQDTFFARVTVADGKLTLAAAPGAVNCRITFIDINAVTTDDATVVAGVIINAGDVQRSAIQSIALAFAKTTIVQSNAISLTLRDGASYPLIATNPSGDGATYVLSLAGGASLRTLPDGVYTLNVDNSKVSGSMASPFAFSFHHLFGDVNGDRTVDSQDAVLFGIAKGSVSGGLNYDASLDYDGDGDIDALDALRFKQHAAQTLKY